MMKISSHAFLTKKTILLFFLISVCIPILGCSGTSDEASPVEKHPTGKRQSPRQTALKFAETIKEGRFEEAKKYTYNLDLNGGSLKGIQQELTDDFTYGRAAGVTYIFDTKDLDFKRYVTLIKVNGAWKVIETYAHPEFGFKNFGSYLAGIASKAPYVLRVPGRHEESRFLVDYFKDKPMLIKGGLVYFEIAPKKMKLVFVKGGKYPSAFIKRKDLKLYRKGTREGVTIHLYRNSPGASWDWKLGKTFVDK